AGGLAGITTDLCLYPLDTLKTRLQSSAGLAASGGFNSIYRGVSSTILGSVPSATLFFVTYDSVKRDLAQRESGCYGIEGKPRTQADNGSGGASMHIVAASLGEIAACAVRVPAEVIKQRTQTGQHPSSRAALMYVFNQQNAYGVRQVLRELYRGWSITITREIPFAAIQFPLWEAMKKQRQSQKKQGKISAIESGLLGSMAGAVAAGTTTPLDLLKTRMMLAKEKQPLSAMLSTILKESGPQALFAGIGPRIMSVSTGGAIFLGSYQWVSNMLE
ncbi:mitochondrial carrier, partial [Lizonia empirigonia]